jgi:hypothetical protein
METKEKKVDPFHGHLNIFESKSYFLNKSLGRSSADKARQFLYDTLYFSITAGHEASAISSSAHLLQISCCLNFRKVPHSCDCSSSSCYVVTLRKHLENDIKTSEINYFSLLAIQFNRIPFNS